MSSDSSDIPLYLYVAGIVVFCIIYAFVAAAKRSLDNTDRNTIKELNEDNPDNGRVKSVLRFIQCPSEYHYANLFISYLTLIGSFVLFHRIVVRELEGYLVYVGYLAFFILFIGIVDILPKKLASQSTNTGLRFVGFQRFIYYITLPFIKLCVGVANFFLLIMRKKTDVDDIYFSEDKVMSMLDRGQESGDIKEEAHKMIDSIFEFDDLLAYEIMTPRTDVFMIDIDDNREEYFDELMELRYSRIPVYRDDPDNIIGILHIKDYLLKASQNGFDNVNMEELLRDPYFVPETKNIDALFVELQKSKCHIAVLIDEYGGFSGLVSIEDIIEQIVGDIDDEFDEEDRVIEKKDDSTYIVDGNVYLDDLTEEIHIDLESDNSETIGGFIIDLMGEIPKENLEYKPIRYENLSFTILEVKDRRIEKVKIEILPEEPEEVESIL